MKSTSKRVAARAAVVATLFVVASLPARGDDWEALKLLARDEARVARDVPIERNVDAATAYRMMTTQKVPLVDVRTPQEYQFVGHVPGAYNIPVAVWGKWDEQKRNFALEPNGDFVKQFSATLPNKDAPVILMCRSGHRSVKATRLLVAAGYSHVYQVWEGFEGIAVPDKDLPSYGKKVLDGWRTKGLPYTWDMDPALVVMR